MCTPNSAQDYVVLGNEKAYTAKLTAHYKHLKNVALHKLCHFKKKKESNVGQQVLRRDLRMLLSGLEVNGPGWYLLCDTE